ncbi:uncharacterized protein G2W53_010031 [Senna tora]|uniref:Uncharacterized protein n=1 Tax=Senna tora TaxID=362788 RepID=A0A835CDL1_9FABA|nr:uncharacterized protein G2W53_010031 [Senna tora]
MRSRCIGNPSGSNARMGLVITWEVFRVMSKHILKGKRRLNLKRIQEAQVRTCCRTSESNGCVRVVFGYPKGSNAQMGLVIAWEMRSRCIGNSSRSNARMGLVIAWESNRCVRVVFGNPKGSYARMGLVIAWELCQVLSKHILKGKPPLNLKRIREAQGKRRLNLKRIQEPQVRTCCRTSESNGCVRVVFGYPKGSNARMGLVVAWEVWNTAIESQKNPRSLNSNVLSEKWGKQMRSRCIGNPSGSNARMGLVIAREVCQVMSKQILKGKW